MAETYYQILGIGVKASPEEVKAAYKRLAIAFHPDKNQGSKTHEERFKLISESYQTLSDPRKRDLYDVKLFYRSITASSDGSSNPDPIYRGVPKTRREKENEAYRKRRSDREAYREYTGPPIRERFTPQSLALTLFILGTVVMVLLWLGDLMNHWTAKEHLANGDYEAALTFDPEYGEAFFARYQARKSYTANQKILLLDLNLAIQFTDVPSSAMLVERAQVFFKMDSINRSISDFLSAKTINPQCDTAFFALAELNAYFLNNPKRALSYYDSTLRLIPISAKANFGKGYMLFRLKRFSSAIEQFDKTFQLDPGNSQLFFYRGSARLALGDSTGACSDLDQALTMGFEEAKPLVDRYCLQGQN